MNKGFVTLISVEYFGFYFKNWTSVEIFQDCEIEKIADFLLEKNPTLTKGYITHRESIMKAENYLDAFLPEKPNGDYGIVLYNSTQQGYEIFIFPFEGYTLTP